MNQPPDPRAVPQTSEGITLADLLRGAQLDRVDARILAMHALGLSRAQLITQSERILSRPEAQRILALFERRLAGEPVAYITGRREFFGIDLEVTPDVLIPRPETELLVELALERLPSDASLLDLGTGSGAIAVAVARSRPDVAVTALDVSTAALQVARRNAERHGLTIRFLQSDWYSCLESSDSLTTAFAVIVSNPPYIVAGDPHLRQGDLRFEPADALTDHADGMTALNAVIRGAARHLQPGGWLLLEHGYDQSASVRHALTTQEFAKAQSWRDLAGIERVSGGILP